MLTWRHNDGVAEGFQGLGTHPLKANALYLIVHIEVAEQHRRKRYLRMTHSAQWPIHLVKNLTLLVYFAKSAYR